jgi:hypothetical protein
MRRRSVLLVLIVKLAASTTFRVAEGEVALAWPIVKVLPPEAAFLNSTPPIILEPSPLILVLKVELGELLPIPTLPLESMRMRSEPPLVCSRIALLLWSYAI